jgi:hypothetical protein
MHGSVSFLGVDICAGEPGEPFGFWQALHDAGMLQSGCDGCLSAGFGWRPPSNGPFRRFIAPIRFVRFLVDLLKCGAIYQFLISSPLGAEAARAYMINCYPLRDTD